MRTQQICKSDVSKILYNEVFTMKFIDYNNMADYGHVTDDMKKASSNRMNNFLGKMDL